MITDALRYEWVRIVTIRSTYWLIGVALTFQLVMSLLIAWRLPSSGPLAGGDRPFSWLVTIGASTGLAPLFIAYVIGLIGVFSMGHEYRHGMIRATLTAVPSRPAVLVAKIVSTAALAAATALACVLIALLSAALFGVRMPSAGALWQVSAGTIAYTAMFALAGLAVATITRHQTAAVALLILVPTVVEFIIRSVILVIKAASDDPTGRGGIVEILRYLPFDAGGQMYTQESIGDLLQVLGYVPLGPVAGGLVMATFVGALLALGSVLFLRRDA